MLPEIPDVEATKIILPFPPSSLSGHSEGRHWQKVPVIKKHREWSCLATLEAKLTVPATGDIRLHIHFVPPDNRGDRTNYWNRCKPVIDGIADALKINDKRFLPSMSFAKPEKPGRLEIELWGLSED